MSTAAAQVERKRARANALAEMQRRQRVEQAAWAPDLRLSLVQELWELAYLARGGPPTSDLPSQATQSRVCDEARARR